MNLNQIADRIIRESLSDKEDAVSFFSEALSPDLVAVLNMDSLERMPGTYIDQSMREYRTDVLFQVKTLNGSFAEIYLLFEHKSVKDPRVYVQLLSYLAKIYEKQKKSCPVIPFVFYHGANRWEPGDSFADSFNLTDREREIFQRNIPDFQFEFFHLNTKALDSLNVTLYLQMLFRIMVHLDQNDLEDKLREIFPLSDTFFHEEKRLEKLRKLLLYIFTKGEIPAERVGSILSSISDQLEKEAMTTAEKLIEQGLKQGIEQGREQGLLSGEQELLCKQLEWKFDDLTNEEKEWIFACTNRDLLELAGRAFAEGRSKHDILDCLQSV